MTRQLLLLAALSFIGLACPAMGELQRGFAPRIRGLSLSSDRVSAGGHIAASYQFENSGEGASTSELTVFVHIVPVLSGPGARQFGADFVPVSGPLVRLASAMALDGGSRWFFVPDRAPLTDDRNPIESLQRASVERAARHGP